MTKLIGKGANQVPVNGFLGNMAVQDKASVEVDALTVTGKALVGGDTAAGDAAAIGYTATEGLILTGQGSTNDVTIKNDADATVFSIPTGSTQVAINSGTSGATANVTGDELVVESSVNGGISILGPNGTYQSLFLGDVADSVSLKVQWDSGNNVGIVGTTKGSAELVLASGNGTEALRIDSSGRVGIGVSAPSGILDVEDATVNMSLNSTGTDAGSILRFQNSGTNRGTIQLGGAGGKSMFLDVVDTTGVMYFRTQSDQTRMTIAAAGTVNVVGTFTAGTKTFRIDHPLPAKTDTHYLLHSSIEGPQADLIYRGRADLVAGVATVNIDTAAGMTEGTFEVLCGDVQCFTSNEDGWTALKGSVTGNVLTITAQDDTCTDTVSWMVIGERKDAKMLESEWADDDGKLIVETLKSEHE